MKKKQNSTPMTLTTQNLFNSRTRNVCWPTIWGVVCYAFHVYSNQNRPCLIADSFFCHSHPCQYYAHKTINCNTENYYVCSYKYFSQISKCCWIRDCLLNGGDLAACQNNHHIVPTSQIKTFDIISNWINIWLLCF